MIHWCLAPVDCDFTHVCRWCQLTSSSLPRHPTRQPRPQQQPHSRWWTPHQQSTSRTLTWCSSPACRSTAWQGREQSGASTWWVVDGVGWGGVGRDWLAGLPVNMAFGPEYPVRLQCSTVCSCTRVKAGVRTTAGMQLCSTATTWNMACRCGALCFVSVLCLLLQGKHTGATLQMYAAACVLCAGGLHELKKSM